MASETHFPKRDPIAAKRPFVGYLCAAVAWCINFEVAFRGNKRNIVHFGVPQFCANPSWYDQGTTVASAGDFCKGKPLLRNAWRSF